MTNYGPYCCRDCAGILNADGECEFCERFERVHDRPRHQPLPDELVASGRLPAEQLRARAAQDFMLSVSFVRGESGGGSG